MNRFLLLLIWLTTPLLCAEGTPPESSANLNANRDRVSQTGFLMQTNRSFPILYVVGDSTVHNPGKGEQGWGDVIGQYFDAEKIRVENHALGGRSSRTFRTQGWWDKVLAAARPGDFVILRLGHNDGGPLDDTNRARGSIRGLGEETREIFNPLTHQPEIVHTYGWYLRQYVREAREHGLTPIICSPIPHCPQAEVHAGDVEKSDYVTFSKAVAESEQAAFIDLNRITLSHYAGRSPKELKEKYFTPADNTHTSPAGAALNAQSVVEGIHALRDCGLANCLSPSPVDLGEAAPESAAPTPGNRYFSDWPAGTAPAEIGKRVAENVLARRFDFETNHQRQFVIYPEVIAEYGALRVAALTHDTDLQARLVQKFAPLSMTNSGQHVSRATHVDYHVFGIVPLEMYLDTKDTTYLRWGRTFADRQWDHTTADGITTEARYWIDDMFMITALQVQAFRATGDDQYLDRAARTMVAYVRQLQQTNGLFLHGTNAPFFWSRGNGWVAAGMAELLRSLPEKHPDRPPVLAAYRKMMTALLKYQGQDGLWRQLIDDPSAWTETSGSGMFTFALVTGVKSGWLEADAYGPAARQAWLGLVRHLDAKGNLAEVCVGTNQGQTREFYLNRMRTVGDLHGETPLLWTAAAFLQ
jgi:rhamnogalacturonyl hydrolase YesR/lysophospholipase L1-like esterase